MNPRGGGQRRRDRMRTEASVRAGQPSLVLDLRVDDIREEVEPRDLNLEGVGPRDRTGDGLVDPDDDDVDPRRPGLESDVEGFHREVEGLDRGGRRTVEPLERAGDPLEGRPVVGPRDLTPSPAVGPCRRRPVRG